jgi:hypothetical protein
LPDPNSVAQVEWLVGDGPDRMWRPIARGVVYRLRRGGSEFTSPALPVAVTTARYWLLRVDQRGGGLGSGVPGLEVGWVPDTLVFAARGESPFQLAYGNRDTLPAAFAIEALIPGYRRDTDAPTSGTSGAHQVFDVSRTRALEPHPLGGAARLEQAIDWKRWSLWGSLVVGVVMLGVMAWRLVRQMDSHS